MKSLISAVFILLTFTAFGQIQNRAQWTFESPKNEVKVGDVVEVKFNVVVDAGWYLYSSEFPAEGPTKAEFKFKKNPTFETIGKIKPVGFHEKYDEIWEAKISIAEGKASFVQKIKILQVNPVIEGSLDGQTCTVKDGLCVPVSAEFKFPAIKVVAADTKKVEATPTQPVTNEQATAATSTTADSSKSS
jgi:thiol:disulfide interchange protein DsbD